MIKFKFANTDKSNVKGKLLPNKDDTITGSNTILLNKNEIVFTIHHCSYWYF